MTAKYYIYRNLHKGNFSIRHRGTVHDRGDEFIATAVTFRVSESGRQRVILDKKKNVHAFCVTDKYYPHVMSVAGCKEITYNPYKASYFTCENKQIEYAQKVYFRHNKCYLIE
jgi:hypothetical protein